MSFVRAPQPPQCVGETIHKDVDFKLLLEQLEAIGRSEDRISFCAKHVPGAATLGFIEASNVGLNFAERAGDAIKRLLSAEENKDKTGVDMGLNRTPAMVLTDTLDQLIMSSDVLTPGIVADVRKTVVAKGGCTISVLFQVHRQKDHAATGSHVEVVVTPDHKDDGPPFVLSLVLTLPDDDKWTIGNNIRRKTTGCNELEPPAPLDDLAKAFSGPEGTRIFGPTNVLLILPRDQWAGSLAETLDRNRLPAVNLEPDCALRVVTHPTEAITTYKGDVHAMSVYKQLARLSEISIKGNRLLSFGGHLGMHSCITNAVRLLACALPGRFQAPESRFIPAKTMIDLLIKKDDGHFLATKKNARINEFDDPEVFKPATTEEIRAHITKIWQDESMNLQLAADMQSWSNMYDNFGTSHPDPNAQTVYLEMARAATHLQESKADELRPDQTLEEMMSALGPTPAQEPDADAQPRDARPPPIDYETLPEEGKQQILSLLTRMEEEISKPKLISDEEMFALSKEIFDALEAELSTQLTRVGASTEVMTRLTTIPEEQSPGDYIVSNLEMIAETLEPGSTRRLEAMTEEPGLPDPSLARMRLHSAMRITLQRFPKQADKIKALLWLLVSDPFKIGLGLMVFWQSIRYVRSSDGGRTAELGPEIAGVLLFVALMPELERLVNRLQMSTGGHLARTAPLTYPKRLYQELPQAVFGGHLIGYSMGLIPSVASDSNVPTRLASELARLFAGLCTVAGVNYAVDKYVFKQEFEHLQTDGPFLRAVAIDIKRAGRDLVSLQHWLAVRGPLAIALGAHRNTTQFWFNIYEKSSNETVRALVGGSQFATFYTTVKLLGMIGGLRYEITDERLIKMFPRFLKGRSDQVEEVDEEAAPGGN